MKRVIYQSKGIDGGKYSDLQGIIEGGLKAEVILGRLDVPHREATVYQLPEGLALKMEYGYHDGDVVATAFGGEKDSKRIDNLEAKFLVAISRKGISVST